MLELGQGHRLPDGCRMAGIAGVVGCHVGQRLARIRIAIVAGEARASGNARVIKYGTNEAGGGVAGIAGVHRYDVRAMGVLQLADDEAV